VAAGVVRSIDPDPADRTLSHARIGDFLAFDGPVPYPDQNRRVAECMLRNFDNPAIVGRALRGRSVRASAVGSGTHHRTPQPP
jgi:putative restriction endonuclease